MRLPPCDDSLPIFFWLSRYINLSLSIRPCKLGPALATFCCRPLFGAAPSRLSFRRFHCSGLVSLHSLPCGCHPRATIVAVLWHVAYLSLPHPRTLRWPSRQIVETTPLLYVTFAPCWQPWSTDRYFLFFISWRHIVLLAAPYCGHFLHGCTSFDCCVGKIIPFDSNPYWLLQFTYPSPSELDCPG